MNTLTKSARALVSLSLLTVVGCASTPERKLSVAPLSMPIKGMACANCAKEIEHELAEVPGVKWAKVNFREGTAKVQLDPDNPASRVELDAAVERWRVEHFGAKEDSKCLDPEKREQIKRGG